MPGSKEPKFRRILLSVAMAATLVGSIAAPALAADDWHGHDGWRRHEWREHERHEWREHRDWDYRGVYPYAYGYAPGYVYAPPPVAYAPPPVIYPQPAPPVVEFGFNFR